MTAIVFKKLSKLIYNRPTKQFISKKSYFESKVFIINILFHIASFEDLCGLYQRGQLFMTSFFTNSVFYGQYFERTTFLWAIFPEARVSIWAIFLEVKASMGNISRGQGFYGQYF